MIVFQHESLAGALGAMTPLVARHWREVALDRDRVPLAPDWEKYRLLDRTGALNITTARHDGRMVGYACYIVSRHLHYRDLMVAESDAFFLAPEHRRGPEGVRLLRAAEQNVIAAGAQRIVTRVKVDPDFGPLLRRMGYQPIEAVYSKRVG
ncbi:MAG: GNAT family N-acetyltransferase [Magnetospirillum sp.]|nr:GNAT family N-acetyltransferase [Magnetospirillum sp.]